MAEAGLAVRRRLRPLLRTEEQRERERAHGIGWLHGKLRERLGSRLEVSTLPRGRRVPSARSPGRRRGAGSVAPRRAAGTGPRVCLGSRERGSAGPRERDRQELGAGERRGGRAGQRSPQADGGGEGGGGNSVLGAVPAGVTIPPPHAEACSPARAARPGSLARGFLWPRRAPPRPSPGQRPQRHRHPLMGARSLPECELLGWQRSAHRVQPSATRQAPP